MKTYRELLISFVTVIVHYTREKLPERLFYEIFLPTILFYSYLCNFKLP